MLLTKYISSPTSRDDGQHVKKHPRLGDVETAQKEIESAPCGVQLNAAHFGCWLKAEMVLQKREKTFGEDEMALKSDVGILFAHAFKNHPGVNSFDFVV